MRGAMAQNASPVYLWHMTDHELAFWSLASTYVQEKFGYTLQKLELQSGGRCYTLGLNALSSGTRTVTIFTEDFRACAVDRCLTEAVRRNIDDACR
jgi:hypothetical protein